MREGALSLVARNEPLDEMQSNYSAWSSVAEVYTMYIIIKKYSTMLNTKRNELPHVIRNTCTTLCTLS